MKTVHVLWERPAGSHTSVEAGRFDTVGGAREAAGHPDEADWEVTPSGVLALRDEVKARYASDLPWMIGPEWAPETDAERVQLATEHLLEWGQTDGEHHKAWVIDQALRLLTGDRYEQVINEYCAGEDGPDTYAWDEGIAP